MTAAATIVNSRFNEPLSVSIFANKSQTTALLAVAKPWLKIVKLLKKFDVRDTKDGWMMGGYKLNGFRSNANVAQRSLVQLDIDSEVARDEATGQILEVTKVAPGIDQLRSKIKTFEWLAHSTYSHEPRHGVIKYRIVILPDRDILPTEYHFVLIALDELLDGCLDRQAWAYSQAFYLPSASEANLEDSFCIHNEGIPLPVDEFVARGKKISNQETKQNSTAQTSKAKLLTPNLGGEETKENVARVKSALAAINPDIAYKPWRDVCWAVLSTGWESAYKLIREWSKRGNKFDEGAFAAIVRDFDPQGGIGLGSLFHIAKQDGWAGTATAAPAPAPDLLNKINSQYAWIEQQASIYRMELGSFITVTDFKNQFANRFVGIDVGNTIKQVSVGTQWLKSPQRREHKKLVLRPDQGRVTDDNCLNTWRGFDVAPVEGDIQPFLRLLRHLVPDKKAASYVLQWMAHLLQNPGVKMNTALVVWSQKQGVGKNLLFECLTAVIGNSHSTVISQSELASNFNGWAANKILIIGDEVSGDDKRVQQDKLKGYITGTTVQINEKYQPNFETANRMNFVFLSNRSDAIFLDGNDRRYFVCEVEAEKLNDDQAAEFVAWRDDGGLEALLHRLSNLSLTGFNPKAPAPQTAAKTEMIADSQSDFENWAQSNMSGGAQNGVAKELVTSAELKSDYEDTGRGKVSTKTVTCTFKRLGAFAFKGQVRLANNNKVRPLAIDRMDYWKQQSEAAWAARIQLRSGILAVGSTPRLTSASHRASD